MRMLVLILHIATIANAVVIFDTLSLSPNLTVACTVKTYEGNVLKTYKLVDGKLHGRHLVYYKTGELKESAKYEYGKIVDTSFSYYQSGKLKFRGVRDGFDISLSENGDTLGVVRKCSGFNCGISNSWYSGRLPKCFINYNDSGQKHGLSEEWREDGTRKDSIVYDNGDIIEVRRYFKNGKLHYHKYQKPVNRDINAVYYDPKGKKVGEVKNGKGTYISYSEDGKSARRVYMENDEVIKIEEIEME